MDCSVIELVIVIPDHGMLFDAELSVQDHVLHLALHMHDMKCHVLLPVL